MANEIPTGLRDKLADRYALERLIARGGMASVYLGRDLKHDRAVAVKVLRPELGALLGAERFLREIKVVARLQHPHILPLYDSGEADDTLYYVMPYVPGDSLRDRLRREKRLSLRAALRITREVADALYYAHANDIVHRDVKPENILLSGDHAVVTDFGIARAVHVAGGERWETLTDSGVAVGTPAYMSPEQTAGDHDIDGRSDIFSLGCVLYEMLAGVPPFAGPDGEVMIARRFTDPPPVLRAVRDDVPETVDLAVQRALAREPVERFANARELTDAIWDDTGAALRRGSGVQGQTQFTDRQSGAHAQPRRESGRSAHARTLPAWRVGGLAALGITLIVGVATVGTLIIVRPRAWRAALDGTLQRPAAGTDATSGTDAVSGTDAARGASTDSTGPGAASPDTAAGVSLPARPTVPRSGAPAAAPPGMGGAAARPGTAEGSGRTTAPAHRPAPERVSAEPPAQVPAPSLPRGDSVLASLHAAARDARGRAVEGGASATDLFRGDSLERAAEASAAAGRVSDAIAQLMSASSAWADGARAARTRETTARTADEPAAPPAAGPSLAEQRTAIGGLIASYGRAIEARDISAIRTLYPAITTSQLHDWQQFFGAVQNIRAALAITRLEITGATADVQVAGTYRYENTSTRRIEEQPVSFRASLLQNGRTWRIAAIK